MRIKVPMTHYVNYYTFNVDIFYLYLYFSTSYNV